ncbi:MAG: hypothetical protein HRT43_15155 [Campylobacteraceae bacterium]|nr:hypothetical protein [Campylobacteraceae bacterium]
MTMENSKNIRNQKPAIFKNALYIDKQTSKHVNKIYKKSKTSGIGMSGNLNSYHLSIIVTNEIITSRHKKEIIERDIPYKTMYEKLNVNLNILVNLILLLAYIVPIVNTAS